MTFSSTDSRGNVRTTWNVRPNPRRHSPLGRSPVTVSPRKRMVPRSGSKNPFSTLNSVVLPAPFGPITPRISRSRTSKLTSDSACSPMNAFHTSRTSSSTVDVGALAGVVSIGGSVTARAGAARRSTRARTACRTRQ